MLKLRTLSMLAAAAAIFLGLLTAQPAISGESKKPDADQQVKDLLAKYDALDAKAKVGAEGERIIAQLKEVRGAVAPNLQEAVARMLAAHNLRQIAAAIKAGEKTPPPGDPAPWGWQLLPYIEQPPLLQVNAPRPRWEYKVTGDAELKALGKNDLAAGLNKLGADGWELVSAEGARFIFKRAGAPAQAFPPGGFRLPQPPLPGSSLPEELLPAKALTRLDLGKDQKEKYDKISQEYQTRRKELLKVELRTIDDGTSNTIVLGGVLSPAQMKLRNESLDRVEAILKQGQKATFQEIRRELAAPPGFFAPPEIKPPEQK